MDFLELCMYLNVMDCPPQNGVFLVFINLHLYNLFELYLKYSDVAKAK